MDTILPKAPDRSRLIAATVASAIFLEGVDATALSTALPTIARDLHAAPAQLGPALTSYMLAAALFIPASGSLAQRLGPRRAFSAALVVFALGSIACACAGGLAGFVMARFVQGAGGALMLSVGQLIFRSNVPREKMIAATSWIMIPMLIGPVIGPPLGGFLVAWADWRWIFYVNIPIAAAAIVLTQRAVPREAAGRPIRFDLAGFALTSSASALLFAGFEIASRPGGGLVGLGAGLAGLGLGLAYVRRARRRPDPILDLSILRERTFRLTTIACSFARVSAGANPLLMPLFLQLGLGLTPAQSGGLVIAGPIGAMSLRWLGPAIQRRLTFRRLLMINGVLFPCAYASFGLFRSSWPPPLIFGALMLGGVFVALQISTHNTLAYEAVAPEDMAKATTLYTTIQQLTLAAGALAASATIGFAIRFTDHEYRPKAFTIAYLIVTAISLLSLVWNARLPRDAGRSFQPSA